LVPAWAGAIAPINAAPIVNDRVEINATLWTFILTSFNTAHYIVLFLVFPTRHPFVVSRKETINFPPEHSMSHVFSKRCDSDHQIKVFNINFSDG
jgi:hypothetical protein